MGSDQFRLLVRKLTIVCGDCVYCADSDCYRDRDNDDHSDAHSEPDSNGDCDHHDHADSDRNCHCHSDRYADDFGDSYGLPDARTELWLLRVLGRLVRDERSSTPCSGAYLVRRLGQRSHLLVRQRRSLRSGLTAGITRIRPSRLQRSEGW